MNQRQKYTEGLNRDCKLYVGIHYCILFHCNCDEVASLTDVNTFRLASLSRCLVVFVVWFSSRIPQPYVAPPRLHITEKIRCLSEKLPVPLTSIL